MSQPKARLHSPGNEWFGTHYVDGNPTTIYKVETTGPELYIRAESAEQAELRAAQHLGMSGIVVSARVATESELSYAREVGLV